MFHAARDGCKPKPRRGMEKMVAFHEGIAIYEMAFAEVVADVAIVMDHGAIVEQGRPTDVLNAPQTARARAFLARLLDRTARHMAPRA